MRRREFVKLVGSATIAWPLRAYAQQPPPLKRVGLLSVPVCPPPPDNPASRRLAELGWIEGRNYVIDCVSTVGHLDQLSALARELVSRRPDVLVASPAFFIRALKQETTTIPIVMALTPDPVRVGLIANLAQPEGNVTGVAWFGFDILPKRIEFLKEIVPDLKRLAIITNAYGDPKSIAVVEGYIRSAASTLGFAWQHFRPRVTNDFDEIFARLAAEHFDAAYILGDPLSSQPQNLMRISQLGLDHRIPTVGEWAAFAKGGFLFSYGQDFLPGFMRAQEYIDKILRGTKPSELAVEQATKLQLVINLKTAKTLGLVVPPSLLAWADEVIE